MVAEVIHGGTDGAIRFFDARSGEVVNVIAAHDHEISELATIPGSDSSFRPLSLKRSFGIPKPSVNC